MFDDGGPGVVPLGAEDRALALAAVKAVLRVAGGDEEDLIVAFAETALGLAEQFIGRVAIVRDMTETLAASAAWVALGAGPVRAIEGMSAVAAGVATPLAAEGYAIDIDAASTGWVRVAVPTTVRTIAVSYRAGMAEGWAALPAPIREGVVLLAAHLFSARDASDPPPAAVTALWRPFRAMTLAGAHARGGQC